MIRDNLPKNAHFDQFILENSMASSRNLRPMHELPNVSSIDRNEQLNQRLKALEDLYQKQNIHVQESNKKIEKLEKQIQELEDKVTGLWTFCLKEIICHNI